MSTRMRTWEELWDGDGNEDVFWRAKRAAVRAAGHQECALLIMEAEGFDPNGDPVRHFVQQACRKVRPIIAKITCEVCETPLPKELQHYISNVA